MAGILRQNLGVPFGIRAPGPELSTLVDVVITGKHRSGILAVVIPGDIVLLLVEDEHRVAARMGCPPLGIDPVPVLLSAIVRLGCNRPVRHGVLAVELNELRALGEDYLVGGIHARADIGPVEHRVVVLRGIHQPSAYFNVGNPRMQGDSYRPLHTLAVFRLAEPDGLRAVRIIHDAPVARHVAGLAMVVEHVPLHASADPGSRHSHIRRLDAVLMVEDVIAVGLVNGIEEPSADGRENAELDIFVLEIEGLIGHHLPVAGHIVIESIRIYAPPGSLVGPVPVEDRGLLCRVQQICRKIKRTFPGLYILGVRAGRYAGKQSNRNKYSFHFSANVFISSVHPSRILFKIPVHLGFR